jgi:hypothetical protein
MKAKTFILITQVPHERIVLKFNSVILFFVLYKHHRLPYTILGMFTNKSSKNARISFAVSTHPSTCDSSGMAE